jgi:hypothetical protein
MAKKTRTGPNKSGLIREYMKNNPSAGPKDIAAALTAEHGIEIKPGFVSTIKFGDKKKGKSSGTGRRGRPPVAAAPAVSSPVGGVSTLDIREAKKFIDKIGSAAKAQEALKLIAEILGT